MASWLNTSPLLVRRGSRQHGVSRISATQRSSSPITSTILLLRFRPSRSPGRQRTRSAWEPTSSLTTTDTQSCSPRNWQRSTSCPGRLEVGLGTGYRKDDYDQPGMQLDSPRVRVDRFLEGLRIVKGFFSGEPFSFSGQYYTVNNLVGKPKPLQRPRPPILIGAGSRRMLSIAAREADIIGVNPRTSEGRLDLASMTRGRPSRRSNPYGRSPDRESGMWS